MNLNWLRLGQHGHVPFNWDVRGLGICRDNF